MEESRRTRKKQLRKIKANINKLGNKNGGRQGKNPKAYSLKIIINQINPLLD